MTVYYKGDLTEHFTFDDFTKNQSSSSKIYMTKEIMLHAQMLEEFRKWLSRPMDVHAWYRTSSYNKKVKGNPKSSHLKGLATDWSTNKSIDKDTFIKYAKKWKEICKAHNVVGEAGLYTWGIHFGSQITYSKSFYHWDSRSGKQINKPFKELN